MRGGRHPDTLDAADAAVNRPCGRLDGTPTPPDAADTLSGVRGAVPLRCSGRLPNSLRIRTLLAEMRKPLGSTIVLG